jgi:hypothetical protein
MCTLQALANENGPPAIFQLRHVEQETLLGYG